MSCLGAAFVPLTIRYRPLTELKHLVPGLQAVSNEPDAIDLRALLGTLLGARWLIAGCVATALALGGIYAWLATPIYQVDATVQVEDSRGGTLGGATKDLEGLFEVKSQATTEIELLRSRMVLGRTVDELGLDLVVSPHYFPVVGKAIARRYRGEQPADGFGSYAWGGERAVVTRLSLPPHLEEKTLTLVSGVDGRYSLYSPDGKLLGEGRVGQQFLSNTSQGMTGLFVRELHARPGVEFALTRLPRLSSIARVQAGLSAAEKTRQSGILQLTFRDTDRARAVAVLNAIANQYLRQNVERKSAEAEQTLKYLEQQLPETKRQLEAAEVRFNDFRSRNGTVDVTREGDLLLQQSVAAETGLVELQQKRKEMLQRFTPEHPGVKTLDSQIAVLQAERGRFAGKLDGLPQTQQEVLRLTRDLQVGQGIYTNLLNSAQQLRVVRGGTVGNVRIIDQAVLPSRPVEPQVSQLLTLSLLMGLMLGVALTFLRQAMRSGVKDPKLIEARTGLSVFATIPHSPTQDALHRRRSRSGGETLVLAQQDDQDQSIESLRSLRTTLHFASLDAANNRLLVTGPAPGVGKSFLSVNLAAVLVASGERVLIVDADMRRGHINEYFGRTREGGLSDVIAGQKTLDETIFSTPISGLDLLTTGAIPPNPSELLLHPGFTALLDEVSRRYDRVIIDCPPIMAVTDAAIVGRHAGTVLLVARFTVTPLAELEAAISRLRQAGVLVNGILLNGVDDTAGYGYGYKYAYGYQYRSRKD